MRLHRLRMRAFGPFADEQTVDFDALGADGLFLLHGQTGAGKTTILDAVAFALFGRVPGARGIKRLHSDHASPQVIPEVELEATISGRRLRILRSPEYLRPKKRGGGTTKENASATLLWVDGSGPDLTRLQDVGEAVVRLLGMSADQFFQVVLLPQGEFAQFLRATSEQREELLERLFDTERFGGVGNWLRERSRLVAARVDEQDAVLDRLAGQVAGISGASAPADPDDAWAQSCLEDARTQAATAEAALTALRAELDQARAAHTEGLRIADLRGRGLQARATLDQLDAAGDDVARAATALDAARRAAGVVPVIAESRRAEKAAATAAAACERASAELAALPGTEQWCEPSSDLDAAITAWTGEAARWEPLARRVAQRPGMLAEIANLDGQISRAQGRRDELAEALAAAPERRSVAARSLTEAIDARTEALRLREARTRLTATATSLTERARVVADIDRADRKVLQAREVHVSAREHAADVRERRLAGMAAELAADLVDGESCAVCGSLAHPAPAAPDAGAVVGEEAEAAASAAEQRAAEVKRTAEASLGVLIGRRESLDELIGDATANEVAEELQTIVESLSAAEELVSAIVSRERALAAIDAEIAEWQEEQARVSSALAGVIERRTARQAAVADLDAEVARAAEAAGGSVDIAARREELGQLITRARALRDARRESVDARERRDELAERVTQMCTEAGFVDAATARDASASPEQIAGWDTLLTEARTVRAAAESTLADEGVRTALHAEPVDTEQLSDQLHDTVQRHDVVASRRAVAAERLVQLQEAVVQFVAALEAMAPLRANHATVSGLADLVAGRGQNGRRMSLHSYVLAARLEEVLVAASARLSQMSSGRYEFVHSDAMGPHGRRGGLGIEVRDEYTGAVRATTTLSGGETFYASLALALGLADVVSAEAGGRVLDTIFIDEGFGTLDPEALDEVMGVLDELRSGGRVVGLVSHVDELRARIPGRLHVIRGENGSRLQMESVALPA